MKLSILEYMRYLSGTENSKCVVEGENVLNAGHLILAGKTEATNHHIQVYALCLQSSALNSDPHEIKGTLDIDNRVLIRNMACSCKAGNSGKCKHISAFLVKCIREDIESLEQISPTDIKCVWSTQKSVTKEKYRPVAIDEMPCLKEKVKKPDMALNKEDILNFFCQNLPNSAVAKHRQGRREESGEDVNNLSLESCTNQNKYIQAILDCSSQSACMMHLASVKIDQLRNCCSQRISEMFEEENETVINFLQHSTDWMKQRKYRVTGSRCYELYTYSKDNWDTKSLKYFFANPINNKFVRHGLQWEHRAREVFIKTTGAEVFECGMIVSNSNQWLGYSPDGVIFIDEKPAYLLEIKCSFEGSEKTILDALKNTKYVHQENGEYKLKKRHKYYGQVQMGMALLNLDRTFFVIYASYDDSILIMEIDFDYEFSTNMLSIIKRNYFNKMLHVLCENQGAQTDS